MLSLEEVKELIEENRDEYIPKVLPCGVGYDKEPSEEFRERVSNYFSEIGYSVAQDAVADAKWEDVANVALRINRHIHEGYQLGLSDIEIIMHDSVLGYVPDFYFRGVLPYLHSVFEYMQQHPLVENDNFVHADTMLLRLVNDFAAFRVIDDPERSNMYYSNFLESYERDNYFYQLIRLWD